MREAACYNNETYEPQVHEEVFLIFNPREEILVSCLGNMLVFTWRLHVWLLLWIRSNWKVLNLFKSIPSCFHFSTFRCTLSNSPVCSSYNPHAPPSPCTGTYTLPTGYRKVPNNVCKPSGLHDWDKDPKIEKCPSTFPSPSPHSDGPEVSSGVSWISVLLFVIVSIGVIIYTFRDHPMVRWGMLVSPWRSKSDFHVGTPSGQYYLILTMKMTYLIRIGGKERPPSQLTAVVPLFISWIGWISLFLQ